MLSTYEAAFTGFAPGFAYLSGLDPALRMPRRSSPRPRVPPGSVAIADTYTAVYPRPSPGGWHLLATTDVTLFDPAREPPALITPGSPRALRRSRRIAPCEVVDGGRLTTVQDAGRPGLAHLGISPSGYLDAPAAGLANRLVGNTPDAAVLETTGIGPALRARGAAVVAVTGAVARAR